MSKNTGFICVECGKRFSRLVCPSTDINQIKYCSRRCKSNAWMNGVKKKCKQCGNVFYRRPSELKKSSCEYCSRKCYEEYRFSRIKKTTYIKIIGTHEHRIVAENALGRKLKKQEIVHHIDGDKHNNKIKNLAILPNRKYHNRVHHGLEPIEPYLLINLIGKS